jgi:HD-GYP domain-containing protein (c-di-GMP phosphodiesterase class II)
MSNDRPYRSRRPREEVIRTLRQGEGKQWDAALVERFLRLVDETDATSIPEAQTAG